MLFNVRSRRKEKTMKLEELLGEELYAQVQAKLDEVNGNEPDKLKHVRYADLSEGNYVGKGKYDALQEALTGKDTELANANNLIAELKKASKGNEEMQTRFTQYEQQNAQLQEELIQTKLKAAIKYALLSEKAVDVDYLTFKLKEKLAESGEKLELDDNENIKGWTDKLAGLKTQFPNMFESSLNKKIEENKLPGSEGDRGKAEPQSLAEAIQQQYENKE